MKAEEVNSLPYAFLLSQTLSILIDPETSYLNAKQTSWKGAIDKSGLIGEHCGAFENNGIGIEAGHIFNDHKLRAWKGQHC